MSLSTDTPTVLWTLRNGAKQLTCSVQLLPHGLQLHLAGAIPIDEALPIARQIAEVRTWVMVGDSQQP